jgi:hypothetical protein
MTDEETIVDVPDETIENEPEPTTDDESTPAYTGKYCNSDDVLALFEDISDDPSNALLNVAIDNTEAWIESNLKRHYVPIPVEIPQTLKTIAIYYASSDILMSLYHGEEYQSLMDYWFEKAQDLLDAYVEEYLNSEATPEEQVNVQMVKHSHARTYNQKRGRRGIWVR